MFGAPNTSSQGVWKTRDMGCLFHDSFAGSFGTSSVVNEKTFGHNVWKTFCESWEKKFPGEMLQPCQCQCGMIEGQ